MMLKEIISDNEGHLSSMRVMLLIVGICAVIAFSVILFCTVWVVLHRDEFPEGLWQAIAAVSSTVGLAMSAKSSQSYIETKAWTSGQRDELGSASARED